MTTGIVKWFNSTKGFGFIQPEGGSKDVFVHVSAMERAGIRQLNDGQAVTFDMETDRNGRESATNLVLAQEQGGGRRDMGLGAGAMLERCGHMIRVAGCCCETGGHHAAARAQTP